MSIAFTFLFKEIFPSYEEWQEFISSNSNIIDYEDEIQASFDEYCWNILSRHFSNVNIRYGTPELFKNALLNVYENKFQQFMKEKQLIDEIYKMTLDEIASLNDTLTNFARNPNEANDIDSNGKFTFISEQTYSKVNSNRFESYLKALNNIPTLNYFKFIKGSDGEMGFIDLFMNLNPNYRVLYEKGDNENEFDN